VTGALAANVVHFARLLRRAGLPVGPGESVLAVQAAAAVDVTRRDDFRGALRAVLVKRREHIGLFDEAFGAFWRDPAARSLGLDGLVSRAVAARPAVSRRVSEALHRPGASRRDPPREERTDLDATLAWSAREVLRTRDFEQMSAEEERAARRVIATLRLDVAPVVTRRYRPDARRGRIDPRATLRAALRGGGGGIPLRRRVRRTRPPVIVALCDVSGSMERYARVLLHFLHALTSARDRVHTFVFGTRLTHATRHLARRDVDVALARLGRAAPDWSGGTRIGACLREFNRAWSRRVLAQGAVVLLITDGLDRDGARDVAREAERLRRSCRRLIWLNPLLRWSGFEPRAAGVRALAGHVDEMRPVHDLASLEDLAQALGRAGTSGAS
jgi:hypothetical protein